MKFHPIYFIFFLFLVHNTYLFSSIEDFGVDFSLSQIESLTSYSKAVQGNSSFSFRVRIGEAKDFVFANINKKKLEQEIRSDLKQASILQKIFFKFSHFALFDDLLVAVYLPVNKLTGKPDREVKNAIDIMMREIRKDFKDAYSQDSSLKWGFEFVPKKHDVAVKDGEDVIWIDASQPLFFVPIKSGADHDTLERIINYQKSNRRSPQGFTIREDELSIFEEQYD